MSSNFLMQGPIAIKTVESFTQPPSPQSSINSKNELEHVKIPSIESRICDIFDAPPPKEDPKDLLRRNDSLMSFSTSSPFDYGSSRTECSFSYIPFPQNRADETKTNTASKKKAKISKAKTKTNQTNSKNSITFKKTGKRNRATKDLVIIPVIVQEKSYQPSSPMKFSDLINNIAQLNLDLDILERITPNIIWTRSPLSIENLPHYKILHPKEALVTSTLRLTPLQYLRAKFILISSARSFLQRSLPFCKTDAQRHLPIDVNKSSKLWEWFTQTGWIKII